MTGTVTLRDGDTYVKHDDGTTPKLSAGGTRSV
jgi:hypothetical protein